MVGENMPYRCPVCNNVFQDNRDLSGHIINNSRYSEKHQEWVESHVYYTSLTGQPLTVIIEKECKVTESTLI